MRWVEGTVVGLTLFSVEALMLALRTAEGDGETPRDGGRA